MNNSLRRQIEDAAEARRRGIAADKGPEYSQAGDGYQSDDADTLFNFKSVAKDTGQTPVQVLMVYFLKHIDSIKTTTREAERLDGTKRALRYASGEGIRGRLDDARNYLDLLECVLVDTQALTVKDSATVAPDMLESYNAIEAASRESRERLLAGTGGVTREAVQERTAAYTKLAEKGVPPSQRAAWRREAEVVPSAFPEPKVASPRVLELRKQLLTEATAALSDSTMTPTKTAVGEDEIPETPDAPNLPGPAGDGTGTGFASDPVEPYDGGKDF